MARNRILENHSFGDLIDVDEVQGMMDLFYELTGAPVGIIDVDNNILVAVGWQDVCTRFHRIHPETREKCFESDARIARHFKEGEFVEHKCKNGLWDLAYPIIIEGRHMATIFLGQFFYKGEEPDRDFFTEQAKKCGFDKEAYLRALDRAPSFSKDFVKKLLNWDAKLALLLARQGLANLKLKTEVAERRRAETELEKHRERLEEVVQERTRRLTAANEQLQKEITERERAEEALRRRTHQLGERVKELNCLFGIGRLVEKPGISLENIMRGAVVRISASLQHPGIACGRITLDGRAFKTDNFACTDWMQSSEIFAGGEPVGAVEVCYLAEKPGCVGKYYDYNDVTVRTRGIEALEAFKAQPDKYDLVISDMTMPNMTGDALSRKMIEIRPDIPIILCTEYSAIITADKAKALGIKKFIKKPIIMKKMAKIIRDVLDETDR